MALRIEELNDTNCKTYLLTVGDEAALVDPVRERLDTYRALLGRRELKLRMVLETHMHADHLMFNRAAKDLLGATIVMHRASYHTLLYHFDSKDAILAAIIAPPARDFAVLDDAWPPSARRRRATWPSRASSTSSWPTAGRSP